MPDSSSTPPLDAAAPFRLVARLIARPRRDTLVDAIQRRRLRVVDTLDLLATDQLPRLAMQSFWLLVASGVGYAALGLAARMAHQSGPLLGTGSPVLRGATLLLANVASYVVMIPTHEAVHAAVILALGGRPRFGLKLPFAAYCTAPGQLFTRAGYSAVALAPLGVLSVAGAIVTWLAPDLGACILFGLAGNVSGAVGDLWTIAGMRRLPADALIEDTEAGYTAYRADVKDGARP